MKLKTIEERFKEIEAKNPGYSTYICFCRAIDGIVGNRMNSSELKRLFDKLVDKDDYAEDEKEQVLASLRETFLNPNKYKAKKSENPQIGVLDPEDE